VPLAAIPETHSITSSATARKLGGTVWIAALILRA
jgi:hypothetical protein